MAELFAKYNCTNCQDDIPGIRVHCVECNDFDLCIQCFASGAEIGPHRNDHKYQLTDSVGTVQLSRAKGAWSGCEALRLLDAIEKYGFGNWVDVSEHIETRTADEAKDEYIARYLHGCIGLNTWPHEQLPRLIDHTEAADKSPLSQFLTQRLPPIDVTTEEASQLQYMPHRNDFEREYDPTAETLISSLVLGADDDEMDVVLQLAQVDIYTRKLRERTRRKRMIQDYQLIMQYFRGAAEARRRHSKDQREFRDRYRVFAQFYTAVEWNRRLSGFEREKALRVRLSELYRYRWNGLQRVADAVHFEQHAAVLQSRPQGPFGEQGKTDRASGERQPSSTPYPPRKTAANSENGKPANTSSTGPRSTPPIGGQVFSAGSSLSRNFSGSTAPPPSSLQNPSNQNHHHQQIHSSLSAHLQQTTGPLLPEIIRQPGGQLLSTSEIHLCTNLNLPATNYVTLKAVLLSGGADNQPLRNGNGPDAVTNDYNSSIEASVKKFLTQAGWLKYSGTA